MANFSYIEGVLDGTGTVTINVGGKPPAFTATLKSAAPGRKIERASSSIVVPTDLDEPEYDTNTATVLSAAFLAPIQFVKFTGAAGDEWNIR